jgi:glutamate carboxypeptidase
VNPPGGRSATVSANLVSVAVMDGETWQTDLPGRKVDLARMVSRLSALVAVESPSGDGPGLEACAALLDNWFAAALGRPGIRPSTALPHLLWQGRDGGVLLLGHFDTVWPLGTLASWPFAVQDGVARGPGVFDMKAGIVQMLSAVGKVTDQGAVSVLLTCDEETGSEDSRPLIEQEARRASAVLVCEPSADGAAVKVARKGVAGYRITVTGRAAHAGLEPELGVNATIEVARQLLRLDDVANPAAGTTVTPTLLTGGTTSNSVPESASVTVDVRGWTRDELDRVDAALRALTPLTQGASLLVEGGVNRYPLEPELAMPLLAAVQSAAADLGLPVPEGVRSGGGSDGNLTSAMGTPTLDGLGAVGGHPHARSEWVDVTAMTRQADLLAGLIDRLRLQPPTGS